MNLPVNIVVFRVFLSNVFPGILKRIPSSASVSNFFTYISDNQLWSYTNHAPVESVAEEYLSANPKQEQLIDKYETELAGYNATTSLVDYIALCKRELCLWQQECVCKHFRRSLLWKTFRKTWNTVHEQDPGIRQ